MFLVLLAQGCGIKGPLYLPTPEQKQQAEARKQRREAALRRDAGQEKAADPAPATSASTPNPGDSTQAPSIMQPAADPFGLSTPTQYPPLP
jgi:predicted small lipoprotein YifL